MCRLPDFLPDCNLHTFEVLTGDFILEPHIMQSFDTSKDLCYFYMDATYSASEKLRRQTVFFEEMSNETTVSNDPGLYDFCDSDKPYHLSFFSVPPKDVICNQRRP